MHMANAHSDKIVIGIFSIAVGFCTACVSSPRSEPAGTAVPPNAQLSQKANSTASAPQREAEGQPRASQGNFAQPPPTPGSPTQPKSAVASAPARRASGAEMRRERGEPRSATAAAADKSSYASGETMLAEPRDLLQVELRPTEADPPDLRAALTDLQSAVEQLSTGHGCDEGCRAYQSMQRAATRICELISHDDPSGRCAAARSRVSIAEQDIKNRCGHCPG